MKKWRCEENVSRLTWHGITRTNRSPWCSKEYQMCVGLLSRYKETYMVLASGSTPWWPWCTSLMNSSYRISKVHEDTNCQKPPDQNEIFDTSGKTRRLLRLRSSDNIIGRQRESGKESGEKWNLCTEDYCEDGYQVSCCKPSNAPSKNLNSGKNIRGGLLPNPAPGNWPYSRVRRYSTSCLGTCRKARYRHG